MKGYRDFKKIMRDEYLSIDKDERNEWLIQFAKDFLSIRGEDFPCLVCDKKASAKGLCQKHYHGWIYNLKTHGTTLESYILWKNNTRNNGTQLLQGD